MPGISASARTKWSMVAIAITLFSCLGGLTNRALGHSLLVGLASAALMGGAISVLEIFYVQSRRGKWLRMRPALQSSIAYLVIVVLIAIASRIAAHVLLGMAINLPRFYARLPSTLMFCTIISGVCILVIRVLHHVGIRTVANLAFGTYTRPTLRRKIFMFVDMNGSTALAERLGAFRTEQLFARFNLDLTKVVEAFGGEIYLHKGDGFVAIWDWQVACNARAALDAVDEMFATMKRRSSDYRTDFDCVPSFRVGIHGGDVVLSEVGDLRRFIGIYGDAINMASRIEDASRLHAVPCAVSDVIVGALSELQVRFRLIGSESFRGFRESVDVYEYMIAVTRTEHEVSQSRDLEISYSQCMISDVA